MTRVELKNMAKEQIQGKIGILFLIFLIIAIIGAGSALVPVVGWFAAIVIMPAFNISLCMIFLGLTKNEDISVGDAFKGFNITGKAVWLNIITNFFVFLWSLLLVIPGIIKVFSYAAAPFILELKLYHRQLKMQREMQKKMVLKMQSFLLVMLRKCCLSLLKKIKLTLM